MATMFDIRFLQEGFLYVDLFGMDWIIPILFTFLLTLLVTRQTNKWGAVFFPMLIATRRLGFYYSAEIYYAALTLSAIAFVVSALGTDIVGSSVRSSYRYTKGRIYGEQDFITALKSKRALKHAQQVSQAERLTDFGLSTKTRTRERALTLASRGLDAQKELDKGFVVQQLRDEEPYLHSLTTKTPISYGSTLKQPLSFDEFLKKDKKKVSKKNTGVFGKLFKADREPLVNIPSKTYNKPYVEKVFTPHPTAQDFYRARMVDLGVSWLEGDNLLKARADAKKLNLD